MAGFLALIGPFPLRERFILRVKEVSFLPRDPLSFNPVTKGVEQPVHRTVSLVPPDAGCTQECTGCTYLGGIGRHIQGCIPPRDIGRHIRAYTPREA